jgi:hypothetical protein
MMHKESPKDLEIYAIVGKEPESADWYVVGVSKEGVVSLPVVSSKKSTVEKIYSVIGETYKKEHNAQIVKFKQVDDDL